MVKQCRKRDGLMAKNSKKNKQTEYAVKYLHGLNKTQTEISLELGVAEAIVEGIINQQPETKPRKQSKVQNMMIRHTAVKKTNNVSIMTEAASQVNDEFKKKLNSSGSRKTQNAIFKPNG